MRFQYILIGLLLAASMNAQEFIKGTRTMKDGTELIEAPIFGTPSFFRTHFASPYPRVQLQAPSRFNDFVVDSHLELSLRNYLELVLANNTDIAIQKLNIESPKNAITSALAIYDPTVTASFRSTRSTGTTTDVLEGDEERSIRLTQPLSVSYQQMLRTGTTYNVEFSGSKSASNSILTKVNPTLSSSMGFSITQPLMRNFGSRVNRLSIMVAQSRLKASQYDLEYQIIRLLAQAESTYWNAVDSRENLSVAEEALKLSEAMLKRSNRELELGAISPLDIYQPEETRAMRQIAVSQASFRLAQALDALRQQMGADLDPDFRHMPITLTEQVLPPADEETIDAEAMVEIAYAKRSDLKSTMQNLDIDDLNYESAKNSLRPDLSLGLNYSSAGIGGTFREIDDAFNVINTIPGGLSDALNQVFGFNFPTYGFNLTLRLPIRDRRAVASLANAAVSMRMDNLRVRNAEQSIRLEVLNAVNQLESSKARVKLAQTSLEFSQKRADAEQTKYDLGVTDIYFLLDAQSRLAEAQSDVVTQAAQYHRNLTNLLQVTGQLLEERGIVVQ